MSGQESAEEGEGEGESGVDAGFHHREIIVERRYCSILVSTSANSTGSTLPPLTTATALV